LDEEGKRMSDEEQTRPDRECGGDVAAYALGALDPAEAEAFRAHLETCAVCRDELAAFREVVDALPLSAPAHRAPATLRRRVLREAGAATGPVNAGRRRIAPAGTARRLRPLRPVAVAAVVLAVVAIAALRLGLGSGPPYRVIHAQVSGRGTAELRLSAGRGRLILHNFAPPPAGEIYEVWTKRADQPPRRTSALFSVTRSGAGDVAVPGSLRRVALVMVTAEPPGGSRVPTHPPVLSVSLG
jgi:anti-sigma-K factor RskA